MHNKIVLLITTLTLTTLSLLNTSLSFLVNAQVQPSLTPILSGHATQYRLPYEKLNPNPKSFEPLAKDQVNAINYCLPYYGRRGGTGQILGKVTDTDTGEPLERVKVSAIGDPSSFLLPFPAYTDASGNYTITGLATGSYVVSFDPIYALVTPPNNYLSEYFDNHHRSSTTAALVSVTDGATIININAGLGRGGFFSGTVVVSDTNLPLASVYIQIYDVTDGWAVGYGSTNGQGQYQTQLLPKGSYKVKFTPYYHSPYLYEYYKNHERDYTLATTLSITQSDPIIANASLERGATITGIVTAADSGEPKSAGVILRQISPPAYQTVAFNDANGIYTATVLTGSYTIEFDYYGPSNYVREFYNNQPSATSANLVTVTTASTISNVNAELNIGGLITGRVTDISGTGQAYVYVKFFDAISGEYMGSIADGKTDALGFYTSGAGLRSGVYIVYFNPVSGFTRDESFNDIYYNDKYSLSFADLVHVTAPFTTTNINTILTHCSLNPDTPTPTATPIETTTQAPTPTQTAMLTQTSTPTATSLPTMTNTTTPNPTPSKFLVYLPLARK